MDAVAAITGHHPAGEKFGTLDCQLPVAGSSATLEADSQRKYSPRSRFPVHALSPIGTIADRDVAAAQ